MIVECFAPIFLIPLISFFLFPKLQKDGQTVFFICPSLNKRFMAGKKASSPFLEVVVF